MFLAAGAILTSWRHINNFEQRQAGNVNDVISTLMTSYQQFWTAARLTGLDKHAVYVIANNSLILSSILITFLLVCSQWIILRFWWQSILTLTWRRFKHALLIKKNRSSIVSFGARRWRHRYDVMDKQHNRVTRVLLTKAYTIRAHVFYVYYRQHLLLL